MSELDQPSASVEATTRDRTFDSLALAQTELETAGESLLAAAIVLRGSDACSVYYDPESSASWLLDGAIKALHRALGPLNKRGAPEGGDIERDIFHVYGTLLVIQAGMHSEKGVFGAGVCENPLANALTLAADTVGRDCNQGLCGRLQACMAALGQPAEAVEVSHE